MGSEVVRTDGNDEAFPIDWVGHGLPQFELSSFTFLPSDRVGNLAVLKKLGKMSARYSCELI